MSIFVCVLIGFSQAATAQDASEWLEKYENVASSDPEAAFQHLVRAASLKDQKACHLLATRSWPSSFDYKIFGKTKEEAVISLLKRSNLKDPEVATLLAIKLVNAERDLNLARELLKHSSEELYIHAWEPYSKVCLEGVGGEADLVEAYRYTAYHCQVVSPISFTGEKRWKLRREMRKKLPHDKIEEIWETMDQKNLGLLPGAFLRGVIDKEQVRASIKKASEEEKGYREEK